MREKRMVMKELVRRCKIDIMCLQESESIMKEIEGARLSKWVASPVERRSRDIMIL